MTLRCHRRRLGLLVLPLGGVLVALGFTLAFVQGGARAAPPQTPTPAAADDTAGREVQAVQDLLARATAEFEGPQQSRSIVLLDDIITRLEALRRQGTLPPRGREILLQCYELRGRAYYNIGLQEKASESFRLLIQLQPQYTLSRDKVSPKIVDYFTSVKKALVGYLAVSSHPPGARVTLNGEFLSLTDFFPVEVLAAAEKVTLFAIVVGFGWSLPWSEAFVVKKGCSLTASLYFSTYVGCVTLNQEV